MAPQGDKNGSSRFGARILQGMGWTEGTGLGAKRDGIVEPLSIRRRKENLGVGAERRPFKDAWWEKIMDDAYGKPKDSSFDAKKEDDLFDACEGRRCRPHGKSKLDRLAKHDLAASTVSGKSVPSVVKGRMKQGTLNRGENDLPAAEVDVDIAEGNAKISAPVVGHSVVSCNSSGASDEVTKGGNATCGEKFDKILTSQRKAEAEEEKGVDTTVLATEKDQRRRRKEKSREGSHVEKKIKKKKRRKDKSGKILEEPVRDAVDLEVALERRVEKDQRGKTPELKRKKRNKRN